MALAGLWLWVLVRFCIAVKTADKPAAKLARGLFVGLWLLVLVHVCIAVKPADKPAAKPRIRTIFSFEANHDGTVFLVTAALDERRVTWPFSIEDWMSQEPATQKRVKERKRKMT